MTHFTRKNDHHLHNPDGTHRATPPTTRGYRLDLWEKQTRRHMERHMKHEPELPPPPPIDSTLRDRIAHTIWVHSWTTGTQGIVHDMESPIEAYQLVDEILQTIANHQRDQLK